MTRAYEETYLDYAMNNLGDMFDYALNDCGFDGGEFFASFVFSEVASRFDYKPQTAASIGAACHAAFLRPKANSKEALMTRINETKARVSAVGCQGGGLKKNTIDQM